MSPIKKVVNKETMPTHWVWWLIWPLLGMLAGGWFFNHTSIQTHHNEAMIEFEKFKNVGSRFTGEDGDKLCESQKQIAEFVRFPGKLPPCEYDK